MQPAVIVPRIDEAAIGQREDLLAHAAIEHARIAALEVGAATAADEERIARERHRAIVDHVGDAAIRVAGGGPGLDVALSELNLFARFDIAIGADSAAGAGQDDAAAELLAQQPRAGDMIGVHVSLEGPGELEAELVDERGVAPRLLEHRVDQQRLTRRGVGEKIRVC